MININMSLRCLCGKYITILKTIVFETLHSAMALVIPGRIYIVLTFLLFNTEWVKHLDIYRCLILLALYHVTYICIVIYLRYRSIVYARPCRYPTAINEVSPFLIDLNSTEDTDNEHINNCTL